MVIVYGDRFFAVERLRMITVDIYFFGKTDYK